MKRNNDHTPTPVIVYLKRDCKYSRSLVSGLEDLRIDYQIQWVDESDSSRQSFLKALAGAGFGPAVVQTPAVLAGDRMLPCNPPIQMIRDLLGESNPIRVGGRGGFGPFSQHAEGHLLKGRLH